MFQGYLDSGGVHNDGIDGTKEFDLHLPVFSGEVAILGQRLWDGDWSATDRLSELHMRVVGCIATRLAARYVQDQDDMIGWAYFGIVDACSKIMLHEYNPVNVTGLIITRAKSLCINNTIDRATGFSRDDIREIKANGWAMLKRIPNTGVDIAVPFDSMIQREFLESFMPTLPEQEFDLLCLYLNCYTDEEAMEHMRLRKSQFYTIKASLELKFKSWMKH